MKHSFQINRFVDGKPKYKDVEIIRGENYLCIKNYLGFSDERGIGFNSIFDEGKYYKLIDFTKDEALFIQNDGTEYYVKSYMDGALFVYFDFSYSLTRKNREEILNKILD